ncbi:HtaA domain-containing protein [Microbacterium caowuchunii]|uniref:HtaA domain-containing protein n=1 Tax=Microbacterium caowuchunii TaxID=2614638 RepID=UPI00177D5982|nr:HtaA domain-containing protein [Microbacterium caowuchunii]
MSERFARHRSSARVAAVVAALALAAAPLLGAAQTPARAASAAVDPGACTIVDGTLTWGVKESFRSYISGRIANGSWEPIEGATYTTPDFGWSGATGTFDPATLAGDAHFPGGVRFTGHDGLLETTITDPTLSFPGDGTAAILMDISSLSMEDALAGNAENVRSGTQVPLVALDLAAAPLQVSEDQTVVTGTAVPAAITAEGFEAFGNYEAGTGFDPVSFSLTVECAAAEPEPEPSATDEETVDATPVPISAESDGDFAWVGVVAGVVGVAVVAGVVVWIVRRKSRPGGDSGSPDTTPGSGAA